MARNVLYRTGGDAVWCPSAAMGDHQVGAGNSPSPSPTPVL